MGNLNSRIDERFESIETVPTLDEAIIKRRERVTSGNGNIRWVDSLKLRENKNGGLSLNHFQIINRNTQKPHHSSVRLTRHRRLRNSTRAPFVLENPTEIIIENDGYDEITAFRDFLNVVLDEELPEESGDYLLLKVDDQQEAEMFSRLKTVLSGTNKAFLVLDVLSNLSSDPELLDQLTELAAYNPDASQIAAAALRLSQYVQAVYEFEEMIESNPEEKSFQRHLNSNPWMFGSDYSEIFDQRGLVLGQITDFPMRRTADGCLEVFEIKRPLVGNLFNYDPSHKSWYPRSELSVALGQVMGYLERIDHQHDFILVNHKINAHKTRAKIVIGRNGNEDQADALRRFNSHLHRVEIITFDQLCSISRNVISHLESVVKMIRNDVSTDEAPF